MDIQIKEIDFKTAKNWCFNYHYSKTLPSSSKYKLLFIVDGVELGVITFGKGACPYVAKNYGVNWNEIYELTRIALKEHNGIFTTMLISQAIKYIKQKEPQLKLLFSFADSGENHKGMIYRASGWYFERISERKGCYYKDIRTNLKIHPKTFAGWIKASGMNEKQFMEVNKDKYARIPTSKKYCYLYFLDNKYKKDYCRKHNLNWKTLFNQKQEIKEII